MRTQQNVRAYQGTELVGGWSNGWKAVLAIGLIIATQGSLAEGTAGNGNVPSPRRAPSAFQLAGLPTNLGFEIGNGTGVRNIFNNLGGYGLAVSALWQVGMKNSFTEIVTSLAEGFPRVRILLGTMAAEYISDYSDLVDSLARRGWKETKIKEIPAVKKVEDLENDMQQINWRVLKAPNELFYVSADGKKDAFKDDAETMMKVEAALATLQFKRE
jgi:hypothetical protein